MIQLLFLAAAVVLVTPYNVTFRNCMSICIEESIDNPMITETHYKKSPPYNYPCYTSGAMDCFDKLTSDNISSNIPFNEPPRALQLQLHITVETYENNMRTAELNLKHSNRQNMHLPVTYLFHTEMRLYPSSVTILTHYKSRSEGYSMHVGLIRRFSLLSGGVESVVRCSSFRNITIHACEIDMKSIESIYCNSSNIFCQKLVERQQTVDLKCLTAYKEYAIKSLTDYGYYSDSFDLEIQFEGLKYNTAYKVLFVSVYTNWKAVLPDSKVYNGQLSLGHSVDISKYLYFIKTYESQYGSGGCNSTYIDEYTMNTQIPTSEHTPMNLLTYIIPVFVCLVSAIVIVVVVLYYKKQKTQVKQKFKESIKLLEPPRYSTMVARSTIDERFEIEGERVVIFKEQVLGQGAFGKVYKGRIKGLAKTSVHAISKLTEQQEKAENMIVAVKQCYEFADATVKRQLIQEIEIMKQLNHYSLVNILYCITQYSDKPISLIMEHCPHGDLLKFLRDSKKYVEEMQMRGRETDLDSEKIVSFNDVAQIAFEVADGMAYLLQKGYIHRDLAARNIMVLEGKHVKIGDFGLCRSIFSQDDVYITNGGKLPIKWMAIESIANYEFSTQSDVWSYGLLLYEVTTLGAQPYADIVPMDGDFRRAMIDHLRSGNRLEQPPACPDEIYSIMKGTWPAKPADRFTFPEIREITRRLLESLHDLDDGVYGDRYIGMDEVVEENYQPLITITRRGKEYAVRKWTIETRV